MTGIIACGRLFRPALMFICAGQTLTSGVQTTGAVFEGDLSERDIGLRVSFAITRTMTPAPDTATVSIFDLAPERRDAMATLFATLGQATCSLALGYDGATTLAFLGTVRSMRKARRMGPDIVTEITADDGGDAFTDAPVSLSTAAINASTLIEVAIVAMNLKITELNAAAGAGFPLPPITASPSVAAAIASARPEAAAATYASVTVGKASELLDEAARLLGVRWWIRDHQIIMARRKVPTDAQAVALTSDMLLAEPDDDGSGIVRLEAMCDPSIVPGRQLALVAGASVAPTPGVTGEPLRVASVVQRGDTRAGPWSASIVARKIA